MGVHWCALRLERRRNWGGGRPPTSPDSSTTAVRGCGGVLGTLACARVGALRPVRGRPWRGGVRAVGSTLVNGTLVHDSIGGVLSNRPRLRSVPLSWRSASPTAGRLENPAHTLHTATRVQGPRAPSDTPRSADPLRRVFQEPRSRSDVQYYPGSHVVPT